ncbi:late competence protein required for DNA uptake (superfamily II DNA/RNA helicase) [Aneurinibacillus soli]|uniref:Transcription-repair-coupling factor n=1 Tax=Aneurinibacillus soli TaxID=1500254 RepID=A0A0U5B4F8_9BACL|nr:helicase-related protein [Aneurinibacillus soli]PYE61495.1 late competence protein required for DNA uptake (superfamily II DNA/RNA helicase) [Aneurinibacillus soli]BAU26550.1 Transcription-repair-coupling factor [Aneurinibacillus soli]
MQKSQVVHAMKEVCAWLEGRALLEEEVSWLFQSKLPGWEPENVLAFMEQQGSLEKYRGIEQLGEGEETIFSFFSSLRRWIGLAPPVRYRCRRCGATGTDIVLVSCARCGQDDCPYCRRCIGMGRSLGCTPYYTIPSFSSASKTVRPVLDARHILDQYPTLTTAQRAAAEAMLHFRREEEGADEFLVWAVCGAGKTEVMFPIVYEALACGGHVLWATPRRDVVLELAPRLAQAFPDSPLSVLYGASSEKWSRAPLVLATTHQALRFYQRFDLVIIDEVDAFPYHGDPVLPFAVRRARQLPGKTVYLTATPRDEHRKRLVKPHSDTDFLPHVKIPIRYHGHPLPVPGNCRASQLNDRLRQKRPIPELLSFLKQVAEREGQAFLFVASIARLPVLHHYIEQLAPEWRGKVETVHAADPDREIKVKAMREGSIRLLLTTTIMERGVTIGGVDVLVVQADASLFDEAALVQIAGRAGRSAACPDGMVLFLAEEITPDMKAAVRHIQEMNQLAGSEM